jgi:hypothetical protein
VDTVPNGGRYDGALGTVLALEAARELDGPFGVLVCAGEEAPRFGAGTLGSRQLVGKLGDADLERMQNANGTSALNAREEFLELLSNIPRLEEADPLSRVAAHLEVTSSSAGASRRTAPPLASSRWWPVPHGTVCASPARAATRGRRGSSPEG